MAVRKLAPEDMQPESFVFSPENEAFADKEIAKYPPGRQASAVIALLRSPGAGRRLAAAEGDRGRRRQARHAGHPRDGSRDLLHDVQPRAGREVLHPVLRHDALRPARRGRDQKVLERRVGEQNHVSAGRQLLLARGRVPRRLLQRADGADQRRLLRGPDDRELREASRRSRRRPAREGRVRRSAASRPSRSRPSTPSRPGPLRRLGRRRVAQAVRGGGESRRDRRGRGRRRQRPAGGQGRQAGIAGRAIESEAADTPAKRVKEGEAPISRTDQKEAADPSKATVVEPKDAGAQPAPQSGKSYVATPKKEGEAVPAEPDDARGRYAACASRNPPRRQRKQAGRDGRQRQQVVLTE